LSYFGVGSEDAVLVGDSTIDLELARAAKVQFVQYVPGYDDGIKLFNPRMKIDHHGALGNVLLELNIKGSSLA
jgi:phosphoglycolate phosphatase-like HAD superfamily hydrolase